MHQFSLKNKSLFNPRTPVVIKRLTGFPKILTLVQIRAVTRNSIPAEYCTPADRF